MTCTASGFERLGRDECALALTLVNDAVVFEFEVGAGNGVGVDEVLASQGPNRREFAVRLEYARGDPVPDLFHDLEIDRNWAGGFEF